MKHKATILFAASLMLFTVRFASAQQAESATDRPKEMVARESELVDALKRVARLARENAAPVAVGAPYAAQPSAPAPDYTLYRLDRIENLLGGIAGRLGIQPAAGGGRNIIVTPGAQGGAYSATTLLPAVTGATDENLLKQIELMQQQINLLTSKLADTTLTAQMQTIAAEFAALRQTQPQPQEAHADTVTVLKTQTALIGGKWQVFFAAGSAKLTTEALQTIAEAARELKQRGHPKVKVTGYASPDGSVSLNNTLSLKRARAVADQLNAHGVSAERLTTEKAGIDSVSDMKTYARRADITIM